MSEARRDADGVTQFRGGRPIIGRHRELDRLSALLTEVNRGAGSVVLVAGEAGIGKTRLCREVTHFACESGVLPAWGYCLEGEAPRHFDSWTQALEDIVAALEPGFTSQIAGDSLPILARVIPSLRSRGDTHPSPALLSARDEEIRLFEAVSRFIIDASRFKPIVLVIDDLHWADSSSLSLFGQIARAAGDTGLLLIGAYRDAGLSAQHPLSLLLATVRRERHASYIPLRALGVAQIDELVQVVNPTGNTRAWARAIWAETDGNPFLSEELIRHLSEVGAFSTWPIKPNEPIDLRLMGVPEGIRQVVALRMARLSEHARTMLTCAAAMSGSFDFVILQALTRLVEDDLLDALDEALNAHLIEPLPQSSESYRFVHAISRHAVYADQSPSRQVRVHRRIAEAMREIYSSRNAEHAAELAIQYHASRSLPGFAEGLPFAIEASDQASRGFSHLRTVNFLRIARDLAVDESSAQQFDVLRALVFAEAESSLVTETLTTLESAIQAAEDAGRSESEIAALLARVAALLKDNGAESSVWDRLVDRGLQRVPTGDRLTWARLTLLRERFESFSSGQINAARWLGSDPDAVQIARELGDETDFARTLQPFDYYDSSTAAELVDRVNTWQSPGAVIRGLTMCGAAWLYHLADFRRARDHFQLLLDNAERFGSIPGQAEASVRLAITNVALGDLTTAQDAAARARDLLDQLLPGHRLHTSLAWAEAYLAEMLGGDWKPIATTLMRFVRDPQTARRSIGLDDAALATLALVRSGQTTAAREMLQLLTPLIDRTGPSIPLANGAVAIGGSAVWALEDTTAAAVFGDAAERLLTSGVHDFPCCSLELTAARMHALRGDVAKAQLWFERARQTTESCEQTPLRAIIDLDEARTLHKNKSGSAERIDFLLDASRLTFQRLGMHEWAVFTDVSVPKAQRVLPSNTRPGGLTTRELEVLRLVRDGHSDRQISDELFLSPRTVNAHIRNMLAKTQTSNRTELSVWAMKHVYAEDTATSR